MPIALPGKREYRIKRLQKVYSILYLLLIAVALIYIVVTISEGTTSSSALAIFLGFAGLVVFVSYFIIEEMTAVVTIETDQIVYRSRFKTRTLPFEAIRGYRQIRSSRSGLLAIVFSSDPNRKEIYISSKLQDQKELMSWLTSNFPDADAVQFAVEEKAILEDQSLGDTAEARARNLSMARKAAIAVNVTGCVAAGSVFLVSDDNTVVLLAAVAFMPLSFLVVFLSKGIIWFNYRTGSAHPSVALGVFAGSSGVMMRALFFYDLLEYGTMWPYVSVVALVVWGLLLLATSEFAKRTALDIGNAVSFLLIVFMYSLGSYIITNCTLDTGAPEVFDAHITNKRVANNKSGTDYYIEAGPIGPVEKKEVHVSRSFYEAAELNGTIRVFLRKGRWGTAWFRTERNAGS